MIPGSARIIFERLLPRISPSERTGKVGTMGAPGGPSILKPILVSGSLEKF